MSNKGIKSAVVVLAVATVMCGCNNSTQAETTKTDTVIGTTDSDINIDDIRTELIARKTKDQIFEKYIFNSNCII